MLAETTLDIDFSERPDAVIANVVGAFDELLSRAQAPTVRSVVIGLLPGGFCCTSPTERPWPAGSRDESGWLEGEIAREYRDDRGEHKARKPAGVEDLQGPLPVVHLHARRRRHRRHDALRATGPSRS